MKRTIMSADPEATITSQQIEHQLDACDPLACVLFSHSPSVQVYYALRSRLESSSEAWLQEFVSLDGLDSLLDSLGHMTGPKFSGFSDAILQIDCLSCIRTVLNSRVGMDTLVNSQDGVRKLLKGVDLVNTLPRKHVLEILSAICVYSKLSYRKLLEALDRHRRENHLYHRFSFIVNELKMAETVPHKTSVLTLINSIICSNTDCMKRCHIRNEFIGLSLLDVISFLQKEDPDEDLYVQLQVFQEKKHEDETTINLDAGLDLSSPQDLADAIQCRVFGGPKMVSFVNILQDLLAIESLEKIKSDTIWHLLEKHVHHIVHGMDGIDSLSVIETESACQAVAAALCCDTEIPTIGHRSAQAKDQVKMSGASDTTGEMSQQNSVANIKKDGDAVHKTSLDSGYIGCGDKSSPPSYTKDAKSNSSAGSNGKASFSLQKSYSPDCMTIGHCQNKETDIYAHHSEKLCTRDKNDVNICKRMNTGNHNSIYDNMSPVKMPPKLVKIDSVDKDQNVLNNLNSMQCKTHPKTSVQTSSNIPSKSNLVLKLGNVHKVPSGMSNLGGCFHSQDLVEGLPSSYGQHNYLNFQRNKLAFPANAMRNLKWIKLNDFEVESCPHSIWANADACKLKIQPDFQHVEEMFREKYLQDETTETPLLSSKARLCLNLFLNRLDEEPIELVKRLVHVDGPSLPLPFIKHLVEILPEHDEIRHLKHYNGNLLDLGPAEQFVLHLSDLPDYWTLLIGHLRRAEFSVKTSHLRSVLASMLETARLILSSNGLREMMVLVLRVGNFLNHGQFNGYAAGYKLPSLTRLTEVKSREPGHNFVHYLVSLADSTDDRVLAFLSEIPQLQKAASCSPADIKADFDKLNTQINSFVKQLTVANPIIRDGFNRFLEEVKLQFTELQGQITELKYQSQHMAEYFCETESFEIQNCFKILLDFFQQLRLCRQEVQLMKKQKNLAARHSGMFTQQIRNKHLALKFGQEAGASSSMMEERKQIIEHLLTELHRGKFSPSILPSTQASIQLSNKQISNVVKDSPVQGLMPSRSGTTTPDRDLNLMELSYISLMGTPMINRPSSEVFDGDLTITAINHGTKIVTSSVNHLPENKIAPETSTRKPPPPVFAIQSPLAHAVSQHTCKTHHRSRSDLAESINVTHKWIRYHQQARQECVKAPLARPESSMTLATLNLETRMKHCPHQQPVALVAGPTIEFPHGEDIDMETGIENYEFVRNGKRGERKSGTLSNFFNKISKKVLRQRSNSDHNSGDKDNVNGGEIVSPGELASGKMDARHEKGCSKSSKYVSKGSAPLSHGNCKAANHKFKEDKENVIVQVNPFDRQKKNPLRLSNRFKGKSAK